MAPFVVTGLLDQIDALGDVAEHLSKALAFLNERGFPYWVVIYKEIQIFLKAKHLKLSSWEPAAARLVEFAAAICSRDRQQRLLARMQLHVDRGEQRRRARVVAHQ